MEKKIVFMFSGQGSQYYNMGKELYNNNPIFKKTMINLNNKIKNIIGESILEHLYNDKKQKNEIFNRTLYTHTAIFMTEYALSQVMIEKGLMPDYVLGTSMGEFASAALAQVMTLEEIIEILVKQAQAFEEFCEEGGMLAILEDVNIIGKAKEVFNNSEIGSVNYKGHFVVSGKRNTLERIKKYLKINNIAHQSLPVSYGFHSSEIDKAGVIYKKVLKSKPYQKTRISFISCLYGKQITEFSDEYFWDIVREPIQFPKAINYLEDKQSNIYIDLGPGGTLASFAKRNLSTNSQSSCYSIMTPFNQDIKNLIEIQKLLSNKQRVIKNKEVRKLKIYVFPGQGSQYKGMGKDLFDEFKEITDKADKILGYSIKELCIEDPNSKLQQTQYTQPALFTVNALTYLKTVKETGKKPDYVAGHSLGEYSALFASGVFDFETGLRLVKKRGELMQLATGGGMAAVIGLNEDDVRDVLSKNKFSGISIANYNSPSQIVISGMKTQIEKAKDIFESNDNVRMYKILKTSGAFHSHYMEDAKREFENFLNEFKFEKLNIPVISNVTARPYKQSEIKEKLSIQITHPVKWTDSIRYLMGIGEFEFQEIGPGRVLNGLVSRIKREAEPLIIDETEVEETNIQQHKTTAKVINLHENIKSISGKSLGNTQFKKDYNLSYAYLTGGMYKGIASKEMVVKMGKAGMMGFFGTGGVDIGEIESSIRYIQNKLSEVESYGMNLLYNSKKVEQEKQMIDMFLKYGVRNIEAAGYLKITAPLVKFRAKGLTKDQRGKIHSKNNIIAKLSRPEVAEVFLSPPPKRILDKLLEEREITQQEADLVQQVPVATDICVEADSGGHTDGGVAYTLMPTMIRLKNDIMKKYKYDKEVRIGAAGGIGTPDAVVAAFMLGADFILTGSINQCTVEANTSDTVKELLQKMNVQHTEYAPSSDMFELGSKVQVLKKGVFFPSRANKLYNLYCQYNSLDDIDENTKTEIEKKYFKKDFDAVYEECKAHYSREEIEKAEKNSKYKMLIIFKWYLSYATNIALNGNEKNRVDYQIPCGPSLGAFNQWVKGSNLEDWHNRHVDEIGKKIMNEAAELFYQRIESLM